jgi:hypothetical protein
MPNRRAAPCRLAALAFPMALFVALASTAWAQAGATGGSSGTPGPAMQSTGPTHPNSTGNGGSGSEQDPHVRGQSGTGTPGSAPKTPGIDPPPSSSGGTTRGTTGGNPDCKTGAPNAADCGGPAPQR